MQLKLLFVLLCFGQLVLGQTKNEKEKRIKLSAFPITAQNIIETLPKHCKRINFYKETDGEKLSFEAKFKYKGKRYSLEFSDQGLIEDLEVLTKFKAVETSIKTRIKDYFKSSYTKHKVIKVQEQYVFDSQFEPSQFITQVLSQDSGIVPNFEIIAEVKANKQRHLREFTFNKDGALLSFKTINPTSYEHVLY
ncbi:hypothetical protein [Winogradskyella sp.]|uniref:hypothetical protein n=1 Tax=Winogradskyella sp. TaxID=1883156 RepID=UPI00261D81AA|nr:hypothetical protein [Winogradskyella sp.]